MLNTISIEIDEVVGDPEIDRISSRVSKGEKPVQESREPDGVMLFFEGC